VGAIMGPDWANLPWVPLLEALCQLDRPADLMRAGLVCRAWHAASAHNRPWRHLCFRDWRATALPQPEPAASSSSPSSFKELYAQLAREHGAYRHLYARTHDMWEAYETWLSAHAPRISLEPPAALQEIELLEAELGYSLPPEMKCALRMHNGQNWEGPGLLGGYSFYDHKVELRLIGVTIMRHVVSQFKRVPLHEWLSKSCPIAFSNRHKFVVVLMEDVEGQGRRGNVVVTTSDMNNTIVIAKDYTQYISSHLSKLQQGLYKVDPKSGGINLFPLPGARGVGVATTRNITVEAAPLFIEEMAELGRTANNYLWAYQIRMHMPSDCSARPCQLRSRRWEITDGNGNREVVEGQGVVGMFPVMEPGAFFQYESCCQLNTASGHMEGHFVMEDLETHESFEIVVPRFEFFRPEPIW